MIRREYWLKLLQDAWCRRSVVWLAGVRRTGKTTLAKMLPEAIYLNCDLPSTQRSLQDPELFLRSNPTDKLLILDEVHQLEDPSLCLKIMADEYPETRVLAIGSSTLDATRKFRDTLTGRKHSIHLLPVPWRECVAEFGIKDLDRRLLHGGLPEPLLSENIDPAFYREWIDSFYARDMQELFVIRNRRGFLSLLRLLLRRSGGQVEYARLASDSGLSQPTVKTHMESMRIACAMHLVPPFHGGGKREIVARPKCYAFDTGFVCHERGWDSIRDEDRGLLWEHLVLDALRSCHEDDSIFYWRDKSGREIDFVVRRGRGRVDTVECKINPEKLTTKAAEVFRGYYPEGDNYVVSPGVETSYGIRRGDLTYTVCAPDSEPGWPRVP